MINQITLSRPCALLRVKRHSDVSNISRAIFASVLMAGSIVLSSVAFPASQFMGLVSVVIIPFCISFCLTKNVVDSLTLVWLNEIYFGVDGRWIHIGPIPGRGLLLLGVFLAYLLLADVRFKTNVAAQITSLLVLFYGAIFPFFLFLYGTAVGGASLSNALSDVMRFSTVLMYFPIRDLFLRNFRVPFGWIIGATTTLGLLFVVMAITPHNIRGPLLVNWMSGGDVTSLFNKPDADFVRAAMTPMIFCFIGVFLGIMYILDSKESCWVRILGLLLTCVSIAPFIINFLRGGILGIGTGIVFFILLLSTKARYWRGIAIIFVVGASIVACGYWISINYIPVSLTKWMITDKELIEIVDPVRIEQTGKMLGAWLEDPVLGKGVGVPLQDYSREESGLHYEVQYPMVLYRVGIVGFLIIMAPFVWMILKAVALFKSGNSALETRIGKLHMAIGLATISLLTASWTNPYFASVMSPLFVVFLVVVADMNKSRTAHLCVAHRRHQHRWML